MILFKKKKKELPPPPPPSPPPQSFRGDIAPIRPGDEAPPELPPLPEAPEAPPRPEIAELPPLPEAPPELPPVPETPELPPSFETPEPPELPELSEEPRERAIPKTSFVDVQDYKKIINDTNIIRSKLMTADNAVKRLNDIKKEEERAIDKWRSQLEDVEKKLHYVDELIAKATS